MQETALIGEDPTMMNEIEGGDTGEYSVDRVTRHSFSSVAWMPLILACGVLLVTVSYSLSRSLRYHEVFTTNERYRKWLMATNWVVILVACLVIAYTGFDQGCNYRG
jgi:hypothetical protein